MINTFPKLRKVHGAATLVVTVMLLVAAALMVIYSAQHGVMQQRSSANQLASARAFEAAEAGLEFAIVYLRSNASTITASPVSGFINYGASNSSLTNVTLGDNSRFSVVYTNPTANNYQLLRITSTGLNPDGTSTRAVTQLVKYKPILVTTPTNPSTVLGSVSLQGSATVTNNEGAQTIKAGSTISYQGSASSTSTTGSSDKNTVGPDISANDATLSGMSSATFFQTFFGTTAANIKNSVTNYYVSGSVPSLDGVTNSSIWIEGDYSQTGNTDIGTATGPVLLIVNGNLSLGGNVTIYGFVFVNGTMSSQSGTPDIIGGFATAGNLSLKGNPDISYNSSVLNFATQQTGNYAKVPGSWRDF